MHYQRQYSSTRSLIQEKEGSQPMAILRQVCTRRGRRASKRHLVWERHWSKRSNYRIAKQLRTRQTRTHECFTSAQIPSGYTGRKVTDRKVIPTGRHVCKRNLELIEESRGHRAGSSSDPHHKTIWSRPDSQEDCPDCHFWAPEDRKRCKPCNPKRQRSTNKRSTNPDFRYKPAEGPKQYKKVKEMPVIIDEEDRARQTPQFQKLPLSKKQRQRYRSPQCLQPSTIRQNREASTKY